MGVFLRREHGGLGWLTIGLGIFALVNSAGEVFDVQALDILGLTVTLLLGPVWALWLGLVLLRHNVEERD